MKRLRSQLAGNLGKGWTQAEIISLKKWYRDKNKEVRNSVAGIEERLDVVVAKIPKDKITVAVQHWATSLTDRGKFVEMQSFENCPPILHDTVPVVLGNDSGQGFCREGVRFCTRFQANSGAKVFVSTLVEGSDKQLSLYQKQFLFDSLTGLKNMETIQIGGKERQLIKIAAMDYEAQAEELGTQVCKKM